MLRAGKSVTLACALALILLLKAPRFWASVKTTLALLIRGLGSPAEMARVSVKLNDPPGATSPPPAAIASASMSPMSVSVKELFALLVESTRLGLSDELVLLTV